ncbi:MAG: glycogen/starch synthase [Candidatus Thorarchaeota archaeon]
MKKIKVWIFTFEYSGIIKVGGLGEVPANQAKYLSNEFEITVFMPSHGQISKLKEDYSFTKFPISCVGKINPSDIGIKESENTYEISFYKTVIDNVNIILLSGGNSFTSKYIDDSTVYNPETLNGKICLFSLGARFYIDYLINSQKEDLPNIIHLHDYHAVIPYIAIKQLLNKNGLDIYSLITIHLLTWPRYNNNFYYACGIDNTPIKISLSDGYKFLNLNEIFSLSIGQPPTVEKVGAIVCDKVTTVSQSYLISDIIPNCGKNLIEFKSDFVYDGCDWDYDEISEQISINCGKEIRKILNIPDAEEYTISDMKKFLLTYKIANLDERPIIRSKKVLDMIRELSDDEQFMKNGSVSAFEDTGPLVITTGRMSQQKGFETIFEAIPDIIKIVPNVKFLFFMLPTDYSLNEIKLYAQIVQRYPENLRIIFGVASDIYYLAHLSADVYCALSRWEPFGINALEAMSSKLPIIATRVGGFQETVIDIRNFWEIGTGILIEKDNSSQFSEALISLLFLEQISKKVKIKESIYEEEMLEMVNQIPDEILKALALLDPDYYHKIKENCYKRVQNNFRWSIVSKKLGDLYRQIHS